MNHNEYRDVEDFLIDNTFQAYCAEENEQCISYWEKYIATHPEQAETIARAKRLFHILAGHKKPVNKQLEAMKQTIAEQESAPRTFRPNFMNILKVAAVLVALGFGYLWFSRAPLTEQPIREMSANVTRYETKLGEKKMFELKDGTKVTLNSGSRLEVEGAFNQEDRHVNLIGEAFFEVAKNKDKPFVLHTNDFDIRVLGTTFNVKSYPEEMRSEALLVEGLIEMKSKGENENSIIVKPNQKVTIYRQVTAVKPKADVIKKNGAEGCCKGNRDSGCCRESRGRFSCGHCLEREQIGLGGSRL